MRFYADLHVHSKYSRATSKDLDLEHLAAWAKRKGIRVVATGDFTHPAWWAELRSKLLPAEDGLYRLLPEIERAVDARLPASCRGSEVRFLLEVEISTIYKKGPKTRKVHHLVYAAEMETASRFREALGTIGNIASDGRPILGLDSRDLLEITLESGPDAFLVPAHIWTPWFSAMGSKSGFDSVDECYGDLAEHIFAVETGLSSDPPMNWRVSHLDRFTLVSSSDAHSPGYLGREANVFDCDPDYFSMRRALETREGWNGTVEFFPEEGKYHLDGHRKCGVRLQPGQTRERDGLCPACGKKVTVGVLHRVEQLADRAAGEAPDESDPFRSLVQLPDLVSELRGYGPKSKTVQRLVAELVMRLGPELEILESVPTEDLKRYADPLLAEAIDRLRAGRVRTEGGYDGEYGTIRVFEPDEIVPQLTLAPLFGEGFEEPARPDAEPRADAFGAQLSLDGAAAADDVPPEPRRAREEDGNPAEDLDASILGGLDADQRAAAEIVDGPLLVTAGPGSGKTRLLTRRIAHLVATGVAPERILAMTFTRRAADEMRRRLRVLLPRGGGRVTVQTFHGLGHWLLRRHHADLGIDRGFRVADGATRLDLACAAFELSRRDAARRLDALSDARREHGDDVLRGDPRSDAGRDLERWRRALDAEALVDFDDLLHLSASLLAERDDLAARYRRRWPHVSVDEYQDVDAAQFRLLRLLSLLAPPRSETATTRGTSSLCVIGDPDQSIYRFRGADVGFFLHFRRDHPEARVVELRRNYRSQPFVLRAAERVLAGSSLAVLSEGPSSVEEPRRFEAASRRAPEPVVFHVAPSEAAEAEFVVQALEELFGGMSHHALDSGRVDGRGEGPESAAPISFDDVAVLYRTKAQARPVRKAFDRAGIPFQERGHDRLTSRPAVRRLLDRLRALHDAGRAAGRNASHWLGVVAAQEGLEGKTEEALEAAELLDPLAERHGDDVGAFLAALELGAEVDAWDPRAEKVSLLTLHAAKGLEWPVVFVVGCDDGLLPLRFGGEDPDPEELAEERRLFFVGITRAERRLYLTRARRRFVHGEERDVRPSPFLEGLDDLLQRREGKKPRRRKPEPDRQMSLL